MIIADACRAGRGGPPHKRIQVDELVHGNRDLGIGANGC
jgi:hypothetical protein